VTESRWVHIVDEVPELAESGQGAGPVMVLSLQGFLDAGNAAAGAVGHLHDGFAGRVVATFEIDAFHDYRARRPLIVFREDHYESYQAPRLLVRVMRDRGDVPYLLMHGPEPDTAWEAFVSAVRAVVEHFGVRMLVSLGSVPMAVPHTRPTMVTQHTNRAELMIQPNVWRGDLTVPASASALIEVRLGEWGHPATGFVAHVPHYLAQSDYPVAAVKLLEQLEVVTGLSWDLGALRQRAEESMREITTQVADNAEVAQVVAGLEQQYDAFHRDDGEPLPLAEERDLPTAEELGEEFERFLADLGDDDRGA
jgi:predicted ATP-grasp superfamily ATP-dependent carboligase